MKINKIILVIGIMVFLLFPLFAQEEEKAEQKQEVVEELEIPTRTTVRYNPGNRRDPFRDLMAGRDISDDGVPKGVNQMQISDIVLIGIVKIRGTYSALINDPQGFPYKVKVGDTFADGYVMAVNDSQVIFEKTMERGLKLPRPRQVIKEIKIEER